MQPTQKMDFFRRINLDSGESLDQEDQGIGIGYRLPWARSFSGEGLTRQILLDQVAPVRWLEVISENYMVRPNGSKSGPIKRLKKLRETFQIALHGVSLSLGSVDGINKDYLNQLKHLIEIIEPIRVSDHLCWGSFRGEYHHDLLPLPYTSEALGLVCDHIDQVQTVLKKKFIIENVSSYIEFSESEMSEEEFLVSVLQRTGCEILLDVNNVYVSSLNHRFNAKKYLAKIPKTRVAQIHLAGHSNLGTHLIDTHDQSICDGVWELYRWTLEHFGLLPTMIERDQNIPAWSEIQKELFQLQQMRRTYLNNSPKILPPRPISSTNPHFVRESGDYVS